MKEGSGDAYGWNYVTDLVTESQDGDKSVFGINIFKFFMLHREKMEEGKAKVTE